jgi:Tfp pilus assembly protein PilE
MPANDKQIDGMHYRSEIQHWDYVTANNLDYFQGQITKYVTRWKLKNGIMDLEKAQHFLEKYIEVEKAKVMSQKTDRMTTASDASKSWKRAQVFICTCKAPNVLDEDCPTHGKKDRRVEKVAIREQDEQRGSGAGRGYVDQG